MELEQVIRRRRMVHRFDRRQVAPEIIDHIIDLARRSPTAGFSQGVDFVVLDTVESIAGFWRLTNDPKFPHDADEIANGPTVVIVPIADKRRYLARYSEPDKVDFGLTNEDAWPVKFWDIDAAMASMSSLLAAVDAGLGRAGSSGSLTARPNCSSVSACRRGFARSVSSGSATARTTSPRSKAR